tara:strand:- start:725 stop:958 length:234 start_codon:yes stop_codon:yes gene_type:complete
MERRKKKYKVNQLTEFDIVEYRDVLLNIEKLIKSNTITEGSVKSLTNIISQLTLVRDKHVDALLNWLKQEYVLEDDD